MHSEEFFPTWKGLFSNPFYFARIGLVGELRQIYPNLKGKLLDVGCGNKPYEELLEGVNYIGLEIYREGRKTKADFEYDGQKFPFDDSSFDCVISNQVFEHVFNPESFLSEIHRVLVPGGKLVLTVPFVWDEHEQPWDYGRYSSFGLKSVLEKNGFETEYFAKTCGDFTAIIQLANGYFFKKLHRRGARFRNFFLKIIVGLNNIFGLLVARILPRNPDLYLDNVVRASKKR